MDVCSHGSVVLLQSDDENDSFRAMAGLCCGLPVVQEVESSLQDVAARVELRGGRHRETEFSTLFRCNFHLFSVFVFFAD